MLQKRENKNRSFTQFVIFLSSFTLKSMPTLTKNTTVTYFNISFSRYHTNKLSTKWKAPTIIIKIPIKDKPTMT